ncbi:WD40 repeat-like protein [Fistulina hepatica ATCC 64428]|uniref:WD40 repeat-like protein n=1 Tax=Fistulina hepatica ATCC 64428 TaxID=1128425 RepID=A0A0D7AB71_9AGAR|nr:WD40 repeat-like protein [Fistulina hepatica ATCC 64428]
MCESRVPPNRSDAGAHSWSTYTLAWGLVIVPHVWALSLPAATYAPPLPPRPDYFGGPTKEKCEDYPPPLPPSPPSPPPNALLSTAYTGHVHPTTVVRILPSGYDCASADSVGNGADFLTQLELFSDDTNDGAVRVWDIVGEDQALKGEYKVISGRINDWEWDGESKRIIAVSDGREKFGHAFMMDMGSSTGEISGHSRAINAVLIRHQRPFRASTAVDDAVIIFYQGTPYKYDKTIKTHSKFVQDVRYALSGDHFASVGSDAKMFIYDGKTGDTLDEFTDSPHKGTIMACAWSPDSKSLSTSSADCTVKLWDAESRKAVTTWTVGTGVNHQQVGNVWVEGSIVSLPMSGELNIFDSRTGGSPVRVLSAPQKAITAAVSTDSDTFLAGTADGRVVSYSMAAAESVILSGQGHTSRVSGLVSTDSLVHSTGWDDYVREIDSSFLPASTKTNSHPQSIAAATDSTVFIVEIDSVECLRSNQKVYDLKPSYKHSVVAAHKSLVAIGGEDSKVHLYQWDGKTLREDSILDKSKRVVTAIAFSPDGNYLAAGDSSGNIILNDIVKKSFVTTSHWSFHSARILSLAWAADSRHCTSRSLDTHVYIWDVERLTKNISIKNANPAGRCVRAVLGHQVPLVIKASALQY